MASWFSCGSKLDEKVPLIAVDGIFGAHLLNEIMLIRIIGRYLIRIVF